MKKKAILKLLVLMLFAVSMMLLVSCSGGYVVSFDSDGGSAVDSVEVKTGDVLKAPVTEKEGYTFAGWYLDNDKWDFEHYAITKNMTLKAKWIKNHTVTFDSNGGSAVGSVTAPDGTKINAPANPIKDGAEFVGWYSGDAKWNFQDSVVTGDLTLTAKWSEIYLVKFDSDGGDLVPSQTVKQGDPVTLPKAPSRYGHEFSGWYNGNEPWDFTKAVEGNLTLKAKWTPIFTVSFSTDGAGKIDSLRILSGSLIPVPAEIKKDGYVFLGWYVGDILWNFETDTVTSDTKLVAKWTPFTYEIVFDKDNGEETAKLDIIPGEKISEPLAPVLEGYAFLGWYAYNPEDDTLADAAWNFSEDVVSKAVTLKAKWIKIWTVSFISNGNVYKSLTVHEGSLIEAPEAPSKDGSAFLGWYNGNVLWNFAAGTVTSDVTLTASFTTKHTVKFDLDGATSEPIADRIQLYGEKVSKPRDPEKPGYAFEGWYAGNVLWNFDTNTVTSDVILTAKWAKMHTVKFETNGGTKISAVQLANGSTLTAPEAPTKNLYIFAGWVTASYVEWDFSTPITEDLTLYARWTANYYTITFETDEGEFKKLDITRGDRVPVLKENPAKENQAFVEWRYHIINTNTYVSFVDANKDGYYDYTPEFSMTLTAQWTSDYWTVTYIDDSNSEISGKTELVAKGAYANNPYASIEAANPGYKFFGWVTKDGKLWNFESYTVESDMELIALWLEAYTVELVFDNGLPNLVYTKYSGETLDVYFTPEKPGYKFVGWYNGNELFDFKTPITTDMVLTAKWEEACTVYYNLSGGYLGSSSYINPETVTKGQKFTEPRAPEKTKYQFAGWMEMSSGEMWSFAEDIADSDVTLIAIWTPKYYVDFNLDGGNGNVSRQEIIKDGVATAPTAPTKDYMTFGGWLLNGAPYDFTTPITSDITLTAKWIQKQFTVVFDATEGVGGATQTFDAGKTITAPNVTRESYVLKEWRVGNASGPVWNINTDILTSDITLVAIWTNAKVTVYFNLNGGTSASETASVPAQTVDYNSIITEPGTPTKNGYIFKGWYRPNGTKWDFVNDTATENIQLSAVWETDYSVKFDTVGGTGKFNEQRVNSGGYATAPASIPVKTGYTFLGWYNGNTKWDFATMQVNDDLILVAKWEIKTFTVTFVTRDPNTKELVTLSSQEITYGGFVARPNVPSIGAAYQFDSWRDENGNVWEFNVDVVEGDMTLKAYWITAGASSGGGVIGPWDENENVQGPIDKFQ
ncbi:MAG: InlB B-repeat-containing protein [Clostridia bacterium]|nr:InlB B-repeat-containing protein [Clostridia bacterium]